jgi:hypothetical protein
MSPTGVHTDQEEALDQLAAALAALLVRRWCDRQTRPDPPPAIDSEAAGAVTLATSRER